MNRRLFFLLFLPALGLAVPFVTNTSVGFAQPLASGLEQEQAGMEVLTRGPLHEAFAEQVNFNARPGVIVVMSPPEPVEEIPPDVQPDGINVEWIPGYWAWDEDRDDFIWVSGVWRDMPPERRWVPGYWAEASGGYQWIAGFWTLEGADEVEYLPYPPDSLESGPTSPQPSVNHYWVTGCWQYRDYRYSWRPGFWTGYREGWIWTPDHYIWTPRGAIYIRGYRDYPLPQRGVAFAPIFFHQPFLYQRRFQYSPTVVINANHLLFNLFVQPSRNHYYWGDYYGDRYRRAGYQPNFAFHGRTGYDPLFSYQHIHQRRQGIDFDARVREWHATREHDVSRRPPRTLKEQQERTRRDGPNAALAGPALTRSLRDVIGDGQSEVRFRQVREDQHQSMTRRAGQFRELAQQRVTAEVEPRADARADIDARRPGATGRSVMKLTLPETVGVDADGRGRAGRQQPERSSERPDAARSARPTAPSQPASPAGRGREERPERVRAPAEATPPVQLPSFSTDNADRGRQPRPSPTPAPTPTPVAPPKQTPALPRADQPAHPVPPLERRAPARPDRVQPRVESPAAQPTPRTPQTRLEDMLNRRSTSPNASERGTPRRSESAPAQSPPSLRGAAGRGDSVRPTPSAPPQQPKPEARRAVEQFRPGTSSTPRAVPNPRAVVPRSNDTPRFQQPQSRPQSQPRVDTPRPERSSAPSVRSPGRSQQQPAPSSSRGNRDKKRDR